MIILKQRAVSCLAPYCTFCMWELPEVSATIFVFYLFLFLQLQRCFLKGLCEQRKAQISNKETGLDATFCSVSQESTLSDNNVLSYWTSASPFSFLSPAFLFASLFSPHQTQGTHVRINKRVRASAVIEDFLFVFICFNGHHLWTWLPNNPTFRCGCLFKWIMTCHSFTSPSYVTSDLFWQSE